MSKPLPEIAPCPWPGCKAKPWVYGDMLCGEAWVRCGDDSKSTSHMVYGPERKTKRGAILAWNRRAVR